MTEREKMVSGGLYHAGDAELSALRRNARRLTRLFNASTEEVPERRLALLRELFAHAGDAVEIEPPFRCDYGWNIRVGERSFMNFDCVILDCAPVTIGRRCLLAPGVHLYTATHPKAPEVRAAGLEMAYPIAIGDDVWIGGRAVIGPGVSIGDGAVIGAGAVVVRDVPAGATVAGVPARPVR